MKLTFSVSFSLFFFHGIWYPHDFVPVYLSNPSSTVLAPVHDILRKCEVFKAPQSFLFAPFLSYHIKFPQLRILFVFLLYNECAFLFDTVAQLLLLLQKSSLTDTLYTCPNGTDHAFLSTRLYHITWITLYYIFVLVFLIDSEELCY